MKEEKCVKCEYKSTPRSEKNIRELQNRLSRVIGQINGVKKMIDDGRYCTDIIIQISASEKALAAVSDILLKEHLETCVVERIKQGDYDVVPETLDLISKMK